MSRSVQKTPAEWALAVMLYVGGTIMFAYLLFSFILAFMAWPYGQLKYAVSDEPGIPQVRAVGLGLSALLCSADSRVDGTRGSLPSLMIVHNSCSAVVEAVCGGSPWTQWGMCVEPHHMQPLPQLLPCRTYAASSTGTTSAGSFRRPATS